MSDENKKCKECGREEDAINLLDGYCNDCFNKKEQEYTRKQERERESKNNPTGPPCTNCNKKINLDMSSGGGAFYHKGKPYCLPCQQKLEADGAAPWLQKGKCANCQKEISPNEKNYCSYCLGYKSTSGKFPASNSVSNSNQKQENSPPKTNYLPWILGGGLVLVGIGVLVWYFAKRNNK